MASGLVGAVPAASPPADSGVFVRQSPDRDVRFEAAMPGFLVDFGDGHVTYRPSASRTPADGVVLAFEGGRDVRPVARGAREVAYEGLYPGIDLVYRAAARGMKYEFRLAAGADPARIRMVFEGAAAIDVAPGGELLVRTRGGLLRDTAPVGLQGGRELPCRFHRQADAIGFACEGYDASRPWMIDPLVYATFLGGAGDDAATALAVDAQGNAYVVGVTDSVDFPATPGALDGTPNGTDAFVAKYDASGALVFATYLGGSDDDFGNAVAIDAFGNVYVGGLARSRDFPTTAGAFDQVYNEGGDAFVAKLAAAGDALLWSTYLGGFGFDYAAAFTLDAAGDLHVVGQTGSTDFPVTFGALDGSLGGTSDAFVAKLSASGGLVHSTYLGGSGADVAGDLSVDESGHLNVVGTTGSTDFPLSAGALDPTFGGAVDGFLARLNETAGELLYGTFLGGPYLDQPVGVEADRTGNVYVAGYTEGGTPTTAGALDTTYGGGGDAFVLKLDATGALAYGTYVGGAASDRPSGLVLRDDNAYLAGASASADFPTLIGAPYRSPAGGSDAFLLRLDAEGDEIAYGTFLGGGIEDAARAVAFGPSGLVFLAGETASPDFPVTGNAADGSHNGGGDAFLAALDATAYRMVLDTLPAKLQVVLDGQAATAPYGFWCVANSLRSVEAPSPQGTADTRYDFASWSDTGAQAHAVLCDAPAVFTATYTRTFEIVVETSPPGLNVSIDGNAVPTPVAVWWLEGSLHTLAAPSPQANATARHTFVSWSDGGAASHSVTAALPKTYVATFDRAHAIVVDTAPAGLRVAVDGVEVDAPYPFWCSDLASVTVMAVSPQSAGDTRFLFASWSDGGIQFHAIACTSAATYTATFFREFYVTVTTDPTNLAFAVDGTSYTSSESFWWPEGSAHELEAPDLAAVQPASRYRWVSWSDGGERVHDLVVLAPGPVVATYQRQYRLVLASAYGEFACDVPDCWYDLGSLASFWVTDFHEGPSGVLHLFEAWEGDASFTTAYASVLMNAPKSLSTRWTTWYRLSVYSRYGVASGGGWYEAGETASLAVSATEVTADGERYRFVGWFWDGALRGADVTMDRPVYATAVWEKQLSFGYAVGIAAAVVGISVLLAFLWRRRRGPGASG